MEELVEKVKNGDKEIYRDLIADMKEELYRIAKKKIKDSNDIEDVIQETIINGYFKIGQLRNNKHFRTWIVKILINECNRFYRDKRHEDDIKGKYKEELETKFTTNNSIGFDNLIQDLNDIERNIFKLYYEEEQSIEDISKILKINPNTIKTKLRRGRQKVNSTYKKIIMTIVILGIITTGITFGKDIINYLKGIFNLSSIGQNNDGILMAIEEKEWVQNVDMDFIELDDNYGIRVNYLTIDDINMYMVFELQSNEILGDYNRFSILDLKIKDSEDNIICDYSDLMGSSIAKLRGWKNVDYNNYAIRELVYMISEGYPTIESLDISFSKIVLYKDSNPSEITKPIEIENKNIHIDIDEKFKNKKVIEYVSEDNNEEYFIQKSIITDTGFYAILRSTELKANVDVQINGTKYKCNSRLLNATYADKKYYYHLVYINIKSEDDIDNILLETNKRKVELYKK